jgi:hypothetical protein
MKKQTTQNKQTLERLINMDLNFGLNEHIVFRQLSCEISHETIKTSLQCADVGKIITSLLLPCGVQMLVTDFIETKSHCAPQRS